ncbi:hypothetical protein [Aestuariimicrobium sp. Y1814]|uniref:hypothetical protein n=1 Tax=Aestuariimicrobium sp. Y1814 TaxID=3418742 RepID=UPI003DA78731
MPTKTYRRHRCSSKHRTFNKLVRCMIPTAAWVMGEGHYATIAWCKVPTVTLHQHAADAQQARSQIDSIGCGGRCRGHHDVVLLVREA